MEAKKSRRERSLWQRLDHVTACSPNVRQPAGVFCACRLGALHLACSKYIKGASWSDVGDSCNSDEGVSDVEGASSIIGTSEF